MKEDIRQAIEWLKTRNAWMTLMLIGWALLILRWSLPHGSEIGITANIIALICFLLSFVHSLDEFNRRNR